jgi:phosphoglycolate phosphatase
MQKLILFDIDKTLITNATGHKAAFSKAVKEVYGIDTTVEIINYNGMTDPMIIMEVLKKHELEESEITAKIDTCKKAMVEHFNKLKDNDDMEILDGVPELLNELEKREFLIGLVTGNLEPIAWGKMKRFKINHYFKLGGFASDDSNRTELVKIAIKRAEENYNFKFDNNVFLFGDTPQDVNAGNEAGILTVGVATGIYSKEDLFEAGASFAVDNLKDIKRILTIIEG